MMKRLIAHLCSFVMLLMMCISSRAVADTDIVVSPPTGDIDIMIIVGIILICAFVIFIILRQIKNGKE